MIEADIFADGHDLISAVVLHRHESQEPWAEARMRPLVNDRWRTEIEVGTLGVHLFTIEAWIDHFLVILAIVNLDPRNTHAAWLELDLEAFQVDAARPFQVHDLLSGARHSWTGSRNYVQINPNVVAAHIFRIRRRVRTERDFECFL